MYAPFPQPEKPPTDEAFAATIGELFWIITVGMDQMRKDHKTITHSYKYSKISGWYTTYDRGKQRLFYLFPKHGDFLLKMVFNEKGVAALNKAEVGNVVTEKLRTAKKYAEGEVLEFTGEEITAKVFALLLRIKVASMS